MDLALEFGMPAEQLARQMTEREFQAWGDYADRRMLPARRVEMQLAQITKWIAMTMGGVKDVSTTDFLLDFTRAEPEDAAQAAREAFQFAPRKKKAA